MSASSSLPERAFDSLFLLWAKSRPSDEKSLTYHPLLCHMLDTAAVAPLIWDRARSGQGPGLVIVEAVMSEGKAEAALLLPESRQQPWAARFLQRAAETRKA